MRLHDETISHYRGAAGDARRCYSFHRAQFSGTIGIRRVHEGQYLNAAEAVANLVGADTLRVNFSLDEQSSAVQVQATLTNRERLLKADMYAGIRVT